MTAPCITLVPPFDVAEFAEAADSESESRALRATLVPAFDLGQYARAAVTVMSEVTELSALEDELRAQECLPPTRRPARVSTVSALTDGQLVDDVVSDPAPPGAAPGLLEALLDEVGVSCGGLDSAAAAGLGHRDAFVLLHVDGCSTLREIVDRCGIPRREALDALGLMLARGIIRVQSEGLEGPTSGLRDARAGSRECEPGERRDVREPITRVVPRR